MSVNKPLRVLSICTSAGLLDKAFIDAGFDVIAGCELMEHKRRLYRMFVGGNEHICHDLADLPGKVSGMHFDLILGGPSCQSHTRLKSIHSPKFPDLTPLVQTLLNKVSHTAFLFENVVPMSLVGAVHTKRNAMNYPESHRGLLIHQSRMRWFTHSDNIIPPAEVRRGASDELLAYPAVAGKMYGAKRGAILQGWPEFARLKEKSPVLQEAIADGVPRGLATAWAYSVLTSLEKKHAA